MEFEILLEWNQLILIIKAATLVTFNVVGAVRGICKKELMYVTWAGLIGMWAHASSVGHIIFSRLRAYY